ncbi:MAG: prephenate dehydratase [Sphingomonadales bacterium]
MARKSPSDNLIAFQGEPGAYSHHACRAVFPDMGVIPCRTFEEAFSSVEEGRARLAMIPVENSLAGRVADNHHLLPRSRLHIVGEHFLRVNHHLLAPPGATFETLQEVYSHVEALGQCRNLIRDQGLAARIYADTAGAARYVAGIGDPSKGAIASRLAGEIYGLHTLRAGVEDAEHNTTRFVIMSREASEADPADGPTMTTFIFQVRNVPAALYKALGGFATNGVNMTKLESYQLGGSFNATQFYADIEGHPSQRPVRLALEELEFFTHEIKILGVYPRHPFRRHDSG